MGSFFYTRPLGNNRSGIFAQDRGGADVLRVLRFEVNLPGILACDRGLTVRINLRFGGLSSPKS